MHHICDQEQDQAQGLACPELPRSAHHYHRARGGRPDGHDFERGAVTRVFGENRERHGYRWIALALRHQEGLCLRGSCLDNFCTESFLTNLRCKVYRGEGFDDVDTFGTALAEYIECYNTKRIKPKLKGLSPVQYQAQSQWAVMALPSNKTGCSSESSLLGAFSLTVVSTLKPCGSSLLKNT